MDTKIIPTNSSHCTNIPDRFVEMPSMSKRNFNTLRKFFESPEMNNDQSLMDNVCDILESHKIMINSNKKIIGHSLENIKLARSGGIKPEVNEDEQPSVKNTPKSLPKFKH